MSSLINQVNGQVVAVSIPGTISVYYLDLLLNLYRIMEVEMQIISKLFRL